MHNECKHKLAGKRIKHTRNFLPFRVRFNAVLMQSEKQWKSNSITAAPPEQVKLEIHYETHKSGIKNTTKLTSRIFLLLFAAGVRIQ
jgi:hypothetical protein